ncbi:unnamed protein product [Rotaria socialis]|uniref:Uncharacterized protein n=1 Tax=Rotaria socialis TaxID=392032 RepID=A0A818JNU4_9BILA|nr:unnamed protein product [Rotaria socialis]
MNSEDVASIILSSNYSGACDHTPLTNEGILKLTDQQSIVIYGPTLFALKYRVLPCTVNPKIHRSTDYVDVSTFNSIGQGVSFARGRQWSSKRKQGGMYHATRLVH